MRTLARTLVAIAIAVTALVVAVARPADATFYNQGVKTVDYSHGTDSCDPAVGGCTPGAGDGEANVLRITQSKDPASKQLAFDGYQTTSAAADHLWMAATLGAECRAGYSLKSARIGAEALYESYRLTDPEEVTPWEGIHVGVPNAKVMPVKDLALNIPLVVAFGGTEPTGESHQSIVEDFDGLDEVYAHGEAVIAQRTASGMTEGAARAQGFTFDTWIATHADVRCEGNTFGRVFVKKMPQWLPLTIQFVGVPQTPVPHRTGIDLTDEAVVTDATLLVAPNPGECVIGLYGWIRTNGPTDVTYRFVDEYGQLSNGFVVHVDGDDEGTQIHHEVAVPTAAEPGPDGPAFAPHQADGPADALAAEESPWITGTYQLRIESPNVFESNFGDFAVDPCVPEPAPTVDLPDVGETAGADPTHGGDRRPDAEDLVAAAGSEAPATTRR